MITDVTEEKGQRQDETALKEERRGGRLSILGEAVKKPTKERGMADSSARGAK